MSYTKDINLLKKEYEGLIGKDVILKVLSKNRSNNTTYRCIIEGVTEHYIILKKEVRPNLFLIETFNYNSILSNCIQILPF